jgi:hypothetical protein
MGGYDIFYATLLSDGTWSKPLNVGYPLNTTDDDLFFTPSSDGNIAFYSFFNPDKTQGLADIYKLELFDDQHPRKFILTGKVRIENSLPTNAALTATLLDAETGKVIDKADVQNDGMYSLNARQGEFKVLIEGDGISGISPVMDLPINNPGTNIDAPMITVYAGQGQDDSKSQMIVRLANQVTNPITLPTIFFETSDTAAIPIPVHGKKNTKVAISVSVNDEKQREETFVLKRRKDTYFYEPSPGLNTLLVTTTDEEGNTFEEEIIISCGLTTPEPSEITQRRVGASKADVLLLAPESLTAYFNQAGIDRITNISGLYAIVEEGLASGSVDKEDWMLFLSNYYSQKSALQFRSELLGTKIEKLERVLSDNPLDSLVFVRNIALAFAHDVEIEFDNRMF